MILEIERICLVICGEIFSFLFIFKGRSSKFWSITSELYAFSNCTKMPYHNVHLEMSMKLHEVDIVQVPKSSLYDDVLKSMIIMGSCN